MKREDFLLCQVNHICLSCPERASILGKTFTALQSKPTVLLTTWVFWFKDRLKQNVLLYLITFNFKGIYFYF